MPTLHIHVGCTPIAADDPDRSKTAQQPVRWLYEFFADMAESRKARRIVLAFEADQLPQQLVLKALVTAREKFDFDPRHEALVIEIAPIASA